MGWISMSGREPQRIEVLSEVLARRRTGISAVAVTLYSKPGMTLVCFQSFPGFEYIVTALI
jgi:hypothetical protein